MSPAFLQAAASYFGINPEQIAGSDWANEGGQMLVTFHFTVSEDDLVGIVERMKVVKLDAENRELFDRVDELKTEDSAALRERWNAMSTKQQRHYGYSFSQFLAVGGATSDAPDFGGLPG